MGQTFQPSGAHAELDPFGTREPLPEITPEFEAATRMDAILNGTPHAPAFDKARVDVFEGVPQVMTFGVHHPVVEALRSLEPGVITIGSFTHAAKYVLDPRRAEVAEALDYYCALPLPVEPNRLAYTTLLDDRGGIVEDLLLRLTPEGLIEVTGNIGNRDVFYERFGHLAGNGFEDRTQESAILYLYGSDGADFIQRVTALRLRDLGWRGVGNTTLDGVPAVFSATTYTPFRSGGEIRFPKDQLAHVWDFLHQIAQDTGYTLDACGLTGRDLARILAGLTLGGSDYRIVGRPDLVVSPTSFGMRLKDGDFLGKRAAEENPLRVARVFVTSLHYARRINAQQMLLDEEGFITSSGYLPDVPDLLARSSIFPYTASHPDEVQHLYANIPETVVVPDRPSIRMTGNHLIVLSEKGRLNPGDIVKVERTRKGDEILGIVCSNLRAWPRT